MDIEARGYANKIENKTSRGGRKFRTFSLGVKQKEKAFGNQPEKVTWANFFVTDFSGVDLQEKAYVTVKGQLKVREYEKDGVKRMALEIITSSVEAPDSDTSGPATAPKAANEAAEDKDPWEP